MHTIMSKKFYLGPKFGTLFNRKWITISELLQAQTPLYRRGSGYRLGDRLSGYRVLRGCVFGVIF
jgi:hypothetical protein